MVRTEIGPPVASACESKAPVRTAHQIEPSLSPRLGACCALSQSGLPGKMKSLESGRHGRSPCLPRDGAGQRRLHRDANPDVPWGPRGWGLTSSPSREGPCVEVAPAAVKCSGCITAHQEANTQILALSVSGNRPDPSAHVGLSCGKATGWSVLWGVVLGALV